MHITGISRLSTSIRCKFELHSLLHCGTTTAQSIFLHTLGLTHSCCKVMTLQHYRHIGAVGSRLNYLRTEYGTPTGSSSCSRTDTKTDLESHDRINVVMLTYHTWHGVPRRSISMLVLAVFSYHLQQLKLQPDIHTIRYFSIFKSKDQASWYEILDLKNGCIKSTVDLVHENITNFKCYSPALTSW